MDDHAVLDHPRQAADVLKVHREQGLSDAEEDPGGLVPLSTVLARLLAMLNTRRVR